MAICLAPFSDELIQYAKNQDPKTSTVRSVNVRIYWGCMLKTKKCSISLPPFAEMTLKVEGCYGSGSESRIPLARKEMVGRLKKLSTLLQASLRSILPEQLVISKGHIAVDVKRIPKSFAPIGQRRLDEVLALQRYRRSESRKRSVCTKRIKDFLKWVIRENWSQLVEKVPREGQVTWLGTYSEEEYSVLVLTRSVSDYSLDSFAIASGKWKKKRGQWNFCSDNSPDNDRFGSGMIRNFADCLKQWKIDPAYSPDKDIQVPIPDAHGLLTQVMSTPVENKELEPVF